MYVTVERMLGKGANDGPAYPGPYRTDQVGVKEPSMKGEISVAVLRKQSPPHEHRVNTRKVQRPRFLPNSQRALVTER